MFSVPCQRDNMMSSFFSLDDKSLALFNIIANHSSDFRISKANLTCKQYYSRISNLIKSDLISRKNRRYFLTSFGKIVYDAQKRIEVAAEDHWKLKAIDSVERSDNHGLPAEEFNKIIDTLIKNHQIKNILFASPLRATDCNYSFSRTEKE